MPTFLQPPLTSAGGAAGVGLQQLASGLYVQSRAQNLVTNGSGLLGDNYNFSPFTFDPTDLVAGAGSFRNNTYTAAATLNDEFIPVDPTQSYVLSAWAKSGDVGGANYTAANQQFFGLACYDIDGIQITPNFYSKFPGSTDTTLAAQLNPGDTTMTVTSAVGWYQGGAGSLYNANIAWYGYTNSKGYTYPNYTYTHNQSSTLSGNAASGMWNTAPVGNVFTLRVPWAGPTLPAGTAIRNASSGGTYKYIAISGTAIPNVWTFYTGSIAGLDVNGTQVGFPYGTAYVKILFLINWQGVANNNVRYNLISFAATDPLMATKATGPDSSIVHIAGTESITGLKTFTSAAAFNGKVSTGQLTGMTFDLVNDRMILGSMSALPVSSTGAYVGWATSIAGITNGDLLLMPRSSAAGVIRLYAGSGTPAQIMTIAATGVNVTVPLAMGAQKITGVADPTLAQDAATKAYVDGTTVVHQTGTETIGGAKTFSAAVTASSDLSVAGTSSLAGVTYEKVFTFAFPNGVASQKFDLFFPTFWGQLELTLTSGFSTANGAGAVKKTFFLGLNPANSSFTNVARYSESTGATPGQFAISDATWDATNSRWRIQIVHRTSLGNTAYVDVKGISPTGAYFTGLGVSALYTTDVTVFPTPVVSFTDALTVGGLLTASAGAAMNAQKITGLANGTASSDAAAFGQIPTALPPSGAAGGDLAGTYPNPTLAATAPVLALIAGASTAKASARVISAAASVNVATGGLLTIDGVVLVDGDRALLVNQTTGTENGIWVAHAGAWTRAADMAVGLSFYGVSVHVLEGTLWGSMNFYQSDTTAKVVGTSALNFQEVGGPYASTGLVQSGRNLSVAYGTGAGTAAQGNDARFASVWPVAQGGTSQTTEALARGTAGLGAATAPTAGTGDVSRAAAGIPTKATFVIGDGATTAVVLNHNLNTRDVHVTVYRATTPWDVVLVDTAMTTVNQITLTFRVAPTASQFNVVVIG